MQQTPEAQSNTLDWMDGSAVPSRCAATTGRSPQRTRKARSNIHSSIASAELSLEDFTDHDQFAFLASMRAQRLGNFIYNRNDISKESRERLDTLPDFTDTFNNKEHALNLAVWKVIDREMMEWQKVCGSGRPSWWSPVTEKSRVRQTYASHTEDPLTQSLGTKRLVPSEEPRSTFRRSLSESSLPSTTRLNDLAYLIAIQLLSACFTLPPEQIPETSPSAYHYYGTSTEVLPDPGLISALRMHTHFRYTPSFGHQARNNSIANPWERFHNGHCTPTILTTVKILPLGSHHEDSRPRKSKRRVRRVLNTTEASSIDEEVPPCRHDGSIDPSEIPITAASTAWHRRKGLRDSNGQEITLPTQETRRINISLPPSPSAESGPKSPGASKSIYTHRHTSKDSGRSGRSGKHRRSDQDQRSGNVDGQQNSKDQRSGSSSKALESQIRSEPHPLFVQPVKELVTKRWRTFRSRFNHGSPSPDPNSTSNDFMTEGARSGESSPGHAQYIGNLNLESPPGMCTPDSTASTNSDGRQRRRRARKESQIHSGSSNETPKFNTPVSETGGMSDGLVAAMDIGRASPTIHLLDPLATTPLSESSAFLSPPLNAHDSARSNSVALPSPSHQKDPDQRSQSVSTYSPRGAPLTRNQSRKNRKSLLSEMHTPDMYDSPAIEMTERPPLSQAGSAISLPAPNASAKPASHDRSITLTPAIEHSVIPFDNATPGIEGTPLGESPFVETPGSVFVDWSAGNVREQAVNKVMENELARERAAVLERESRVMRSGTVARPRLVRMSTSGTQCFTPNEDGVEVDGLPVGPGLEEAGWNVELKGKGRKLRESSFL